jgi:hypothetical protein
VIEVLRQGPTTAEIARRLFVSQVTVRTHICSILKKLGVHDRPEAARLLGGSGGVAASCAVSPVPSRPSPSRAFRNLNATVERFQRRGGLGAPRMGIFLAVLAMTGTSSRGR